MAILTSTTSKLVLYESDVVFGDVLDEPESSGVLAGMRALFDEVLAFVREPN